MNKCVEKVNRVLIAGTNSGCGKTTVTLAVLAALNKRGAALASAKCGPDYIDPMFHRSALGVPSTNLDPFFFDENTLRFLLASHGAEKELTVIEGVMGYYDGLGATSRASTYEAAKKTATPVILTVNAKGASLSVLAAVKGFSEFEPDSLIRGVILNNCTEKIYSSLAPLIEARIGIRPLGFMPKMPECELGSRHLGLITADEVTDLKQKLARLAEQAEKSLDLDGIIALAASAPELSYEPVITERLEPFRIAVARDRAFCFYYEDSLAALSAMGAELVPFSPLADEKLPDGIHGLYLGGGYPELNAKELAGNETMLKSIRTALENGLPCVAECGGFMYLTEAVAGHPAVGFIRGTAFDTGRLTRFGYVTLTAKKDNMLCEKGDTIPAHEFHRWDCDLTGDSFTAEKADGRSWDCVFATDTLYAGFPHFHFLADPRFAENFARACIKEKHNDRKH
ncbi:MAG: cobyrinate a,c-diamide synthase [Clostridiales bacterium]|nr:cobyrinate a,c-diamide synthase [Clostridiales bacterium]